MGRRVEKIAPDPAQSIRYVWDGPRLLYELRADGRRLYGHNPVSGELIYYADDGVASFVLRDQVGAPAELLDTSGALRAVIRRDTP